MKLFYQTADVYRYSDGSSSEALGLGWGLVLSKVPCAINNGTGVGVARKEITPDVERQTVHYFQGTPSLVQGDLFVSDGELFRMGSPYNCRNHHIEVTTERIGQMSEAVYRRRKKDYFDVPTDEVEGEWTFGCLLGSKRSKEETVSGTGTSIKPIKVLTMLTLPEGLDAPKVGDLVEVKGFPYTVVQANRAVANADPGLWTLTLAEGEI